MSREELRKAGDVLGEASEAASDPAVGDRLADQADQMASHAEADRGPDHGRLARHERILADVAEDADEDVAASVEEALGHVRAYRETVEGV